MLRSVVVAVVSVTLLAACGAGTAVRPDPIRGAQALDDAPSRCPTAHSTPLVVDWKADERADLELAMRRGIAVVAYTCDGIKLLVDCHVAGDYGYAGVTQQEEDVQIVDSDELHATLPKIGALMGADLSTALERGASIDIATLLVGKKRTTVTRATRKDLIGACAEASHFVRGASLGAFAMKQGTRGKIEASATLFGTSDQAASESNRSMTSKAGVLDACKQADPSDTDPPKQCGTPFRVELDAIDTDTPAGSEEPPSHDADDRGYVCPRGLVDSGGKCARPGTVTSFACRPGDLPGCTEQCDKGNASSCVRLGGLYADGRGGVAVDPPRGFALFRKACDLGNQAGCVAEAVLLYKGDGAARDTAAASALLKRECDAGSFYGCAQLSAVFTRENRDPAQAMSLALRACNGGNAEGCVFVGRMYQHGSGVPKDPARAAEYFKRGCAEGKGVGIGCGELGDLYGAGEGVPKDDAMAFHYLELGCGMPMSLGTCGGAATYTERGRGTTRDPKRAWHFLRHGCDQGEARSCARMGAAVMRESHPDPTRARALYDRACALGNAEACEAAKNLPAGAGR